MHLQWQVPCIMRAWCHSLVNYLDSELLDSGKLLDEARIRAFSTLLSTRSTTKQARFLRTHSCRCSHAVCREDSHHAKWLLILISKLLVVMNINSHDYFGFDVMRCGNTILKWTMCGNNNKKKRIALRARACGQPQLAVHNSEQESAQFDTVCNNFE